MGNQLKKEYDVNLDAQCGSGGLGLRWRLYLAIDLKSKEEVTIFTFSKKELPKALRKDCDRYIKLLKKEVERGYKFKHPNCLRIVKPIKEFRGELAFVTERVSCSLSNILGDTICPDDIGDSTSSHFTLPSHLMNYKFGALQLRSGLAQLCDATLFMHNDAHMAHGFIDPCNVYITPCGDWKLFGFEFAQHLSRASDEAQLHFDFTNNSELPYYPTFNCLAPEIMICNVLTVKSDVFAMARLLYIIHRQQSGIRREAIMKSADEYRRFINDLNLSLSHIKNTLPFEGIPQTLIETLKNALKTDEKLRCSVTDIVNCKYLNDMIVRVIRYLDKILEKEVNGKIKFLKKLPEVISMFDKETLIHKVIPPLLSQIKDERMTNYVVPALMKIIQVLNCDEYQRIIEPVLCRYFVSTDLPQVFYSLCANIVLLCSKSSVCSRRDSLIPMVLLGLKVRNVAIQTNLLKNIPQIVDEKYIEWKDLKNKMLPKLVEICGLSVGQNHLITPLRVNVLMCLAKIFTKFDSETITKVILKECVFRILSKSKETAILMSVLGVADACAKHVNPQIVASDILPHIIPLLMQPNLNQKQYNTFIKCVRSMIDKIDGYRVNQLHANPSNDESPKSLADNTPIHDSMQSILEQEFDPHKQGQIHRQIDDPFAPKPNDNTSLNTHTKPAINIPAKPAINQQNDNNTQTNEAFVSLSTNAYSNDINTGTIGTVNDDTFTGFDTKPTKSAQSTTSNAPPIYGTKCAIIRATTDETESFGWNQDKEDDVLFTQRSDNSNNVFENKNESSSSFTVKPFGSSVAKTDNSYAPPQSKRRARAKGSIKPAPKKKTIKAGFVGFEAASSTANMKKRESAFGFINDENKDNDNEDMFSGMGIKHGDIFAGLGHAHRSNTDKNDSNDIGKSGFDFMNSNDSKNKKSDNSTQSMFLGFSGAQTVTNNNKKSEDPFAGLF